MIKFHNLSRVHNKYLITIHHCEYLIYVLWLLWCSS
jgi:hypothetical protein